MLTQQTAPIPGVMVTLGGYDRESGEPVVVTYAHPASFDERLAAEYLNSALRDMKARRPKGVVLAMRRETDIEDFATYLRHRD